MDPEEVKNDITNINITSIEFVYMYDFQNKEIIQPVFLLSGSAKIKGSSDEADVSFYLPAFAE